jgi:hypothetical protein
MKLSKTFKLVALLTATVATFNPIIPTFAQVVYEEKSVDQNNFIPVALPLAGGRYNLLLIEQIPGKQQCWQESGSAPVTVNLLLNNFDFTGSCRTFRDSNGYSIRIDGVDYGLDYRLDIEQNNNELQLVGSPIGGSNKSKIVIGRTYGLGEGPLKFELETGWDFSQRTYQNRTLGHMYFTGDSVAFGIPSGPAPAFRDIARDIYRGEIEEAVAIGFIKGFEDRTFKPQDALTRAQIVSMVFDALGTVEGVTLPNVTTRPSAAPFPDVPTNHWAAPKIKWAQDNDIVTGFKDGSFKPNDPVRRGELMAILRKTTLYAQKLTGKGEQIVASGEPASFTDTSGHWAASTITEMTAFCNVATALNESGNAFYPNNPAQRNYAAAATLRMLKCVNPQ